MRSILPLSNISRSSRYSKYLIYKPHLIPLCNFSVDTNNAPIDNPYGGAVGEGFLSDIIEPIERHILADRLKGCPVSQDEIDELLRTTDKIDIHNVHLFRNVSVEDIKNKIDISNIHELDIKISDAVSLLKIEDHVPNLTEITAGGQISNHTMDMFSPLIFLPPPKYVPNADDPLTYKQYIKYLMNRYNVDEEKAIGWVNNIKDDIKKLRDKELAIRKFQTKRMLNDSVEDFFDFCFYFFCFYFTITIVLNVRRNMHFSAYNWDRAIEEACEYQVIEDLIAKLTEEQFASLPSDVQFVYNNWIRKHSYDWNNALDEIPSSLMRAFPSIAQRDRQSPDYFLTISETLLDDINPFKKDHSKKYLDFFVHHLSNIDPSLIAPPQFAHLSIPDAVDAMVLEKRFKNVSRCVTEVHDIFEVYKVKHRENRFSATYKYTKEYYRGNVPAPILPEHLIPDVDPNSLSMLEKFNTVWQRILTIMYHKPKYLFNNMTEVVELLLLKPSLAINMAYDILEQKQPVILEKYNLTKDALDQYLDTTYTGPLNPNGGSNYIKQETYFQVRARTSDPYVHLKAALWIIPVLLGFDQPPPKIPTIS